MKKINLPLKSGVKKILWIITGGYQPKKFWDKWAEEFIRDPWQRKIHPQHRWMLKKIREAKPKNILEVGCGFGRNIKFLVDNGFEPKFLEGSDISSEMIKLARKYVKDKRVKFRVAQAANLPYKDKSFDLVLIHGVLMHVKPEEIEKSIREVLRVSLRYALIFEQNYDGKNNYTFLHDYDSLFKNVGIKIIDKFNDTKIGLNYYYVKVR